jgi:hypothetical protein
MLFNCKRTKSRFDYCDESRNCTNCERNAKIPLELYFGWPLLMTFGIVTMNHFRTIRRVMIDTWVAPLMKNAQQYE